LKIQDSQNLIIFVEKLPYLKLCKRYGRGLQDTDENIIQGMSLLAA